MKTEQEQIEKMAEKMKRCFEKNGLLNFKWFAEALVQAGYGEVSEYKAEIERLRQELRDTDKMARNSIEQYKNNYDNAFERLKAQGREIGRLKEENEVLKNDLINSEGNLNHITTEIKQLKAKNKVLGDGVAKAFTNGFNTGRKQVEKDIRRAQIDVLNKLKDSYGVYYLSAFGVKERMLADILNPMIEELKK